MKRAALIALGWLALLTGAHGESQTDHCLIHVWKGTVGATPVMMEFDDDFTIRRLTGKYYYRTSLVDLILKKDEKVQNGWREFDLNNHLTALLTLKCTGNNLAGEWKSADGKTTLPIRAEIAKSYSEPRLSAVQPSVLSRGSINIYQYEIIGVPDVNNANTVVEGLRLVGHTAGIQKINKMLLGRFLSAIDMAISCNTHGRFYGSNVEYESDSKVIAWNNDFVVIYFSSGGYCGDALHPIFGGAAETYSLSSGDREDISLWLSEPYRQPIALTSELGQILAQAYIKQRANEDANECLRESAFNGLDVWPSDVGIVFVNSVPYATSGCAEKITIPYQVIWPYLSQQGQTRGKSFMMRGTGSFHEPTLCKANEEVIFSCAARTKTISLCASADASANIGRLTYRFGIIGHPVEMEYPEDTTPPGQAFKFAGYWAPKGGTEQLAFTVGNYTYTVYSSHWAGIKPEELSGVLVEAGAKRIANIQCTDPVSQLGLHYIGIDKFHFIQKHFIGLPSANIRPDVPYVRGDAP